MSVKTFTDQMGREVVISSPPRRIVSLVPSQTEFLVDINAPVIGRTKFCIHPADKVKDIPVIGGTKKFNIEAIRKLNPDLIIGNKEENYQEGIEELEKEFPVWMSDIFTLEDSFEMMAEVGRLCCLEEASRKVIHNCKQSVQAVKGTMSGKAVYLIWKNPWMAAGKKTFIDHMLSHLGFENLVADERYPELTDENISALHPEKILLSSEPFPFKEKHLKDIQLLWPEAEVQLVDGELYSWYGSRLKEWC